MLPELVGARRILAVRLDNIGDVVLTEPALRALSDALPGAEITLLASRAGAQVAPLMPWVRDVIVQRPVWQDVHGSVPLDPDREIAFAWALREREFDAAFVFTSFRQSGDVPGYVAYLAGIPVRVGHAPLFSGGVFSHPVLPPPDAAHQVDRNLALVERVGIEPEDRSLELRIPPADQAVALALLTASGLNLARPFAVVAPGASAAARRYPEDRFGAVAGLLAARTGLPIVFVGHEREANLVARAEQVARTVAPHAALISLVGRTPLGVFAAILERAALLVANDSGPMHIADAFATPQLVLFSGSDLESQWRPRSSPAVLLRKPTECSPCYAFECPFNLECLDFDPADVVDEALGALPSLAVHRDRADRVRSPQGRRPRSHAVSNPPAKLPPAPTIL